MFRLAMGVSFDEKSEKQLGVPLVIFLLFFFFFPNARFLLEGREVLKLHINGCKVNTIFKEAWFCQIHFLLLTLSLRSTSWSHYYSPVKMLIQMS